MVEESTSFSFQLASLHCFWCQRLENKDSKTTVESFLNCISALEKMSVEKMKQYGNTRIMSNREVTKMFTLQYYKELVTDQVF